MRFLVLLLLAGCWGKPVVLTDTDIVYQDKLVPVPVPPHLLEDCQVTQLPQPGETWTWYEILGLAKQKDFEQATCNERFGIIEDWQRTEIDADIN